MREPTARVSYDQPENSAPRLSVELSDGYSVQVVIEPDSVVSTVINQLHESIDRLQRHLMVVRHDGLTDRG